MFPWKDIIICLQKRAEAKGHVVSTIEFFSTTHRREPSSLEKKLTEMLQSLNINTF